MDFDMKLDLAKSVAAQLKTIIDQAVESGEINTENLRIILLAPNSLFDTLQVLALNEWDTYYYRNKNEQCIGEISIAEWLDVADEAFERRDQLDDGLIPEAAKYEERYQKKGPAIDFKHVTHEQYKSFLVCLREALVSQIEEALRTVAVSYTLEDFTRVVGFAAHQLRYADEGELHFQGFNHPMGAGPFYNVRLTLPQIKLTYPWLNFYDSGFILYYPEGNMFEESDAEGGIYQYDVSDFNFVILSSKENDKFEFRLIEEFDNWRLQGGHINEDEGDLSEEALLKALNELFMPYPEKILNKNLVPDPLRDGAGFEKWMENIVINNLAISFNHKDRLFEYGEEAFRRMLELLPDTHKSYEGALKDLAERLFVQDRFEESLAILKSIKSLTDHTRVNILENLYYLGQKEEFDRQYELLENKIAKGNALLLKWLFDLSLYRAQKERLLALELEICTFIREHKGYAAAARATLALTKLYVWLNEKEKALYHFQEIPISNDIERVLFLKEFDQVPFLRDAYQKKTAQEQERNRLSARFKEDALVISDREGTKGEMVYYEDCYRIFRKYDLRLKWVHPLTEKKFVGINHDDELFLAEFSENADVVIRHAIRLEKQRLKSYVYDANIIYVVDVKAGIVRYGIEGNTIVELEGQYRNARVPCEYRSVSVSNGYLYACNNDNLEIFDLSKQEEGPLTSELFIESGYSLLVHGNLLVVGAGAGLVLLIDVADKRNPKYLSSILEHSTPGNMHVEFIDQYMISLSVVDISDPCRPRYVCDNKKTLAPIYYFAEKPQTPLFCVDDEYPFRTLSVAQNKAVEVKNWLGFLDEKKEYPMRITSVLATSFCGDTLIGFSDYGIHVFEKSKNPQADREVFNVQEEVQAMVYECFEALVEQQPGFRIGKVVLQRYGGYGILCSFQECSSPAVLAHSLTEKELPMVTSMINLYDYFNSVHSINFNPESMSIQYDGQLIFEKLLKDPRFTKMAAKHVSLVVDDVTTWLHFPGHTWHPFRKLGNTKNIASTEGILLSESENLLKKLAVQMNEDTQVLDHLLEIINRPFPKAPKSKQYAQEKPGYVNGPTFNADHYEQDVQKLKKQKQEAFRLVCSHKDRQLVKNILLNAIKYGVVTPVLETIPNEYAPGSYYLSILIYNLNGLLDEFSQDIELKTFLLDQLDTFEEEEQLRLAYHYQLYTHAVVSSSIHKLLSDPYELLDYHTYLDHSGTSMTTLPLEVLAPFEARLLEILNQYESTDKPDYHLKNVIVPVLDMLYRLGHDIVSEKIRLMVDQAKKRTEHFVDDFFGTDYVDEDTFLVNLFRKHQVKQVLAAFIAGHEGPLWPENLKPEPYEKSWNLTISKIFEQGHIVYGSDFGLRFVTKLAQNIAGDERYAPDRLLAFNFVKYVYRNILTHSKMAGLAEILIKAIYEHKGKFSEEMDLYSIKEKCKFTLLQAAWNDMKDKNLELAAQKAEVLLQLDPGFGQVYFLKARLLWLTEGVQAYLEREAEFVKLSSHEPVTLARLYNLKGCALDVLQRYEEALPCFKKAALEEPGDPMYVANIAEIYYKLNNAKEALNHAKKAKANGSTAEILKEILGNKGVRPPMNK